MTDASHNDDEIRVTSAPKRVRRKRGKKKVPGSVVATDAKVIKAKVRKGAQGVSNGGKKTVTVLPPPIGSCPPRVGFMLEVTRVEKMMLRGVYDPAEIAAALNASNAANQAERTFTKTTVQSVIAAVEARWEYLGQATNTSALLGKELASLANVEQEYWDLYDRFSQRPGCERDALFVLKCIIDLFKQRTTLTGIDKVGLREIKNASDAGGGLDGVKSPNHRAKVIDLMNKFIKWASDKKKIDSEAVTIKASSGYNP